MLHKISFLSLILFSGLQLVAQNLIKSEDFKVSFEVPEIMENYENNFPQYSGYESDNYGIDINAFVIDGSSTRFKQDFENETMRFAKRLLLEDITDGGFIPNSEKGYYVACRQRVSRMDIPAYAMVLYNLDHKLVYQIVVYCYSGDAQQGDRIIKSFKLLD